MEILLSLLVFFCVVGIGILVVVKSLKKSSVPKRCPNCDAELPVIRKPANFKQGLLGGWNCPNCGVELDRNGNKQS